MSVYVLPLLSPPPPPPPRFALPCDDHELTKHAGVGVQSLNKRNKTKQKQNEFRGTDDLFAFRVGLGLQGVNSTMGSEQWEDIMIIQWTRKVPFPGHSSASTKPE